MEIPRWRVDYVIQRQQRAPQAAQALLESVNGEANRELLGDLLSCLAAQAEMIALLSGAISGNESEDLEKLST